MHHFFVCTNGRPAGHPLPSCAPRGGAAVYAAFTRELAKRGFPEGVKVTASGSTQPVLPTHYELLHDIIGQAQGLPEDMAINHNHYIRGGPKQ